MVLIVLGLPVRNSAIGYWIELPRPRPLSFNNVLDDKALPLVEWPQITGGMSLSDSETLSQGWWQSLCVDREDSGCCSRLGAGAQSDTSCVFHVALQCTCQTQELLSLLSSSKEYRGGGIRNLIRVGDGKRTLRDTLRWLLANSADSRSWTPPAFSWSRLRKDQKCLQPTVNHFLVSVSTP